jgi:polyprenyl P-hydroxybenzoate/phenylacrylic acid decarboxylase-like protein
MKLIVGMCGASGVGYGIGLLKALKESGVKTFLITSRWAEKLIETETGYKPEEVRKLADHSYSNKEMDAPLASSSFLTDGMIIIPSTVKTASDIAYARSGTLISRAADNILKMRKKLVVCIRETPLSTPALESLHKISLAGGIIFPLSPGFYHRPKNLDDIIGFTIGKLLDLFKIENKKFRRWR